MTEKIMGHRDLLVWKLAIDFSSDLYEITEKFPKEERYGITQQLRRAGVSVPSNIAEGAARKHPKEFMQFLYISMGSLSEIETQLLIAEKRRMIVSINDQMRTIIRLRKMILGLINNLSQK